MTTQINIQTEATSSIWDTVQAWDGADDLADPDEVLSDYLAQQAIEDVLGNVYRCVILDEGLEVSRSDEFQTVPAMVPDGALGVRWIAINHTECLTLLSDPRWSATGSMACEPIYEASDMCDQCRSLGEFAPQNCSLLVTSSQGAE